MGTETAQENPRLRIVLEEAVRRGIPKRVRRMSQQEIAEKLTEMRTETQALEYIESIVNIVRKDPHYLLRLGIRREPTGADRDRVWALAGIVYQEIRGL